MARPIRRRMGGATPWYRVGGISPSNVLGAWAPKKAASYAASKISLVNPSASNLLADGAAYPTWANGTGWTFAAASSQYLTIATAIATAVPLTMVCRFASDDITGAYVLMSICDTGGVDNEFALDAMGNVGGDPLQIYTVEGATAPAASTTTGYTANVFYSAAGVFSAANARAVYIDGGSKGTDATSSTPAGLDTTYIGVQYFAAGLTTYYKGKISACAFYNIALSDAQILAVHNAMVLAGL